MNFYEKEKQKSKLEKTFASLQDDVLDEYNKGTISKEEMKNIIKWCEKMKQIKLKDINES